MDYLDIQVVALAVCWGLYFAVHSVLASFWVKTWVAERRSGWMRGYRLFFNLTALLLLLPPLGLTFYWRGPYLWQWTGLGAWLANGMALLALAGFAWSLRYYDGSEFLGLRQWRLGLISVRDQERFQISPLHRFVRHPWYSLGLVLVWSRDMDPALLTSALLISLYFLVGSRLEERKLLVYHGEAYRRYRERVPALLPSPFRHLTQAQAQRLLDLDRKHGPRTAG